MRRFIVYDIYSQTVQLLQISKVRTDDCVSDSMINGDTLEAGFIRSYLDSYLFLADIGWIRWMLFVKDLLKGWKQQTGK